MLKFTDGFGYIITVTEVDQELQTLWDDEGEEFLGHTCHCTDNRGDEWYDAVEHLETMYEKYDE